MADKYTLSETTMAKRRARDKQDRSGQAHENGTCGGYNGLCSDCLDDEAEDLQIWAAAQPAPTPNEDLCAYWQRINGPFYDAWYYVASKQRNRTAPN